MPAESSAIHITEVTLICSGCKGERVFNVNPPLVSAADVKKWLETEPTQCRCGATKCDAQFKLNPMN